MPSNSVGSTDPSSRFEVGAKISTFCPFPYSRLYTLIFCVRLVICCIILCYQGVLSLWKGLSGAITVKVVGTVSENGFSEFLSLPKLALLFALILSLEKLPSIAVLPKFRFIFSLKCRDSAFCDKI